MVNSIQSFVMCCGEYVYVTWGLRAACGPCGCRLERREKFGEFWGSQGGEYKDYVTSLTCYRANWVWGTTVSKEITDSVFRIRNVGSNFLRDVGIHVTKKLHSDTSTESILLQIFFIISMISYAFPSSESFFLYLLSLFLCYFLSTYFSFLFLCVFLSLFIFSFFLSLGLSFSLSFILSLLPSSFVSPYLPMPIPFSSSSQSFPSLPPSLRRLSESVKSWY